MSTYWGLRCEDCKEDSPHWFNRGEGKISEIVGLWPHIKPLRNAYWVEVDVLGGCDEDPTIFEFLNVHYGHKLMLANEYGKIEELLLERVE